MILFFALFFVLFAFNIVFPPQSDDVIHQITANSNQGFFYSYFAWNGRIGEIFYTGCLASINHTIWFDIINSLVGSIFIFAFFFVVFARLPKNRLDFLTFALICLMIVNMHFADIFLWGAGSLNYLWGIGLIILFLIPYRLFWGGVLGDYVREGSVFVYFCLIPISVFAGWSSEHIGATLSFVLIFTYFYAYYKKVQLPMWYHIGSICFLGGWLILFFSPGSAKRAAAIAADNGFVPFKVFFSMNFLEKIMLFNEVMTNFIKRGFAIFYCCFIAFFVYKMRIKISFWRCIAFVGFIVLSLVVARHVSGFIVCGLVCYLMWILARHERKYFLFLLLFLIWMLIALTLFQLRGDIAHRAHLGDGLILATLIVLMFRDIYHFVRYKNFLEKFLGGLLVVSVVACFCNWAYVGYNWHKVVKMVEEQKSRGIREVVVPEEFFYSYYSKGWGAPDKEPNWINLVYARYFDVDKFIVK